MLMEANADCRFSFSSAYVAAAKHGVGITSPSSTTG